MKNGKSRLVSTPTSDKAWSPRRKKPHGEFESGFGDFLNLNSMSIELETPLSGLIPDVERPKTITRNPALGYLFMVIAVFGLTVGHISSKIAFENKPTLTNVDWLTFFGIWLLIVYFTWSRFSGVDLSIKKLPPKPLIALVASLVVTVICNLLLFKAISLISVGKSTLIFSTNPMFAMMLASCLLSEQIQKIVIGSTIGAFVGIYFLTQNKENVKGHEENLVLGVLCVFLGAWFQALIFVLVRMISVHNINFMIRPFYAGWTFVLFAGLVTTFHRSSITFETYDIFDVIVLSMVGLSSCMCIGPLSLAMKYEEASKLSPILYVENVFTLLADALLFDYKFISTDYLGIWIISVCLWIPAVMNIMKKS